MVRSLLLHILKAYQMVISPFLGENCRYYPSCSEYMIGCITKHGALKGSWFGTKRILRCHPLLPGGHDPIP